MLKKNELRDRFRGCLLGGVLGADLCTSSCVMREKTCSYGRPRPESVKLENGELGHIVQELEGTAKGILQAEAHFVHGDEDYLNAVEGALGPWRKKNIEDAKVSVLLQMAPLGLFFEPKVAARLGAAWADRVHTDMKEKLGAATLAHLLSSLVNTPELPLLESVRESLRATANSYRSSKELDSFLETMVRAARLAQKQETAVLPEREIQEELGEEPLPKAVYAALKYEQDLVQGLEAVASNRQTDLLTGAVLGNILGAHLGSGLLPAKELRKLPRRRELVLLAYDLEAGEPYKNDTEAVAAWCSRYLK